MKHLLSTLLCTLLLLPLLVRGQKDFQLVINTPTTFDYSDLDGSSKGAIAHTATISKDGQWLATSSEIHTQIWDITSKLQSGQIPVKLPEIALRKGEAFKQVDQYYQKLAFIPNSYLLAGVYTYIATSYDRQETTFISLRVWDWKNQLLVKEMVLPWVKYPYPHQLQFELIASEDGQTLVLGTPESDVPYRVLAWKVSTWEEFFDQNVWPLKEQDQYRLRLHPDGQQIAIASRSNKENISTLQWELNTGRQEHSYKPDKSWSETQLIDFSYTKDGRFLEAIYSKKDENSQDIPYLFRWESQSGRLVRGKGTTYQVKKDIDLNFYQHEFLHEHGRFYYTRDDGIIDFYSDSPDGLIIQEGNGIRLGRALRLPLPQLPTSLIHMDISELRRSATINDWEMVGLVDMNTGITEHFINPQPPAEEIQQVSFGKDGLLILNQGKPIELGQIGTDIKPFVSLLSPTHPPIGALKLSDVHLAPKNTAYLTFSDPAKWGQKQYFLLNIKTGEGQRLLDYIYAPDFVTPSHQTLVTRKDVHTLHFAASGNASLFKLGEQPIYTGKPIWVTQQGDFLYGMHDEALVRCRLPKCKNLKKLAVQNPIDFLISPDDRWLILRYNEAVQVYDLKENAMVKSIREVAVQCVVSPDSRHLYIASTHKISIYDLLDFRSKRTLTSNLTGIRCIDLDPDGKRMAIANSRQVEIRKTDNNELIATCVNLPADQQLVYTPDNYYFISKGAEENIAFRRNARYYSFEHFDLYYNRPDIVLERLGYSSKETLTGLKAAHQKRLEKHGISQVQDLSSLQLPEVHFVSKNQLPIIAEQSNLQVEIEAWDQQSNLSRIQLTINEVPLLDLSSRDEPHLAVRRFRRSIPVQLTAPQNVISVQCWNEKGVPSLKDKYFVRYTPKHQKVKPDLHLAVVGVSRYKDQSMNLRYAAKDAHDVLAVFQDRQGAFNKIYSHELLDHEVTKENINSLRKKLMAAKPEDRVILFVAGHGILDDQLDFYFATHDIDFSHPKNRGVTFQNLESLLADVQARQKVLFMDACHSGELDKASTSRDLIAQNTEAGKVTFRSFGNRNIRQKQGLQNAFTTMKDLFVDLRRKSGTIVISAAAGVEMAIEGGELANGVFTFALLEGMGAGNQSGLPADKNRDKQLSISELQKYVMNRVPELTNGMQQPTSRVEYLYNDFTIWEVKGAEGMKDLNFYKLDLPSLQSYVAAGGSINDRDYNGATLLMQIILHSDDPELARWLIKRGANPKLKGTIPLRKDGKSAGYYGNLTGIAAGEGKLDMLKLLIEECKIPVDDLEYEEDDQADTGWTALQWAANNGQLETVRYLIEKGANINFALPGHFNTPLIGAAKNGHLEVVKYLINKGAKINQRGLNGWTPLLYAARFGHPEVVNYLIEQGADLNLAMNEGWTPLMSAGLSGHYQSFDHLLRAGADIRIKNKEGKDIIQLAEEQQIIPVLELIHYKHLPREFFIAIKEKDQERVLSLVKAGASLNAQDDYGASMFMHIIATFDDVFFIKQLMKYKPKLDIKGVVWTNRIGGGYYGNLQCIAAAQGKLDLLKYLIEDLKVPLEGKEYDPKDKDHTGWTALEWAVSARQSKTIRYLLDKGANPNAGLANGSALPWLYLSSNSSKYVEASIFNRICTVENVKFQDASGWTVWHLVARSGLLYDANSYASFPDPLIDFGADPNCVSKEGFTPLNLAAYYNQDKIFSYLVRAGADANLQNKDGSTALMFAAQQGHLKSCQKLVEEYKARCKLTNNQGQTAADIATAAGHLQVATFLKSCR